MPAAATETVLFAIQAALRLQGAIRKAYVDATLARPLRLPLPRSRGATFGSARNWFTQDRVGTRVARRQPRIARLLALAAPTAVQKNELTELYLVLYAEHVPFADGDPATAGQLAAEARGVVSEDELTALLEVRQWADGDSDAPPTALQQVAGTLVNLAVDYFATTPGAVSETAPEGRLLRAFLRALDDHDFATAPVRELSGGLMVAVLDSVAATPEILAGGDKEQLFVSRVTTTLAAAARDRLTDAPEDERRAADGWLRLIATALLESGSEIVLANPVETLGVRPGAETDLVTRVGRTLTDLLLGGERPTFRRLLSGDGLHKIVQASLAAVADNPELMKVRDEGLRSLLSALANDLSQWQEPLSADLFPEIARRLLARTAENLELVWGRRYTSPERHLLLTASRSLLTALARKPPPGTSWKPHLTRDQTLAMLDAVFDEVIDNPAWVLERLDGGDDFLATAVEAMLTALRRLDGRRVSTSTGLAILRAGLAAVARRAALLEHRPDPGDGSGGRWITLLFDAVFEQLFAAPDGTPLPWWLARNSTLISILQVVLDIAAEFPLDDRLLATVRATLGHFIEQPSGFSKAAFHAELARRLTA